MQMYSVNGQQSRPQAPVYHEITGPSHSGMVAPPNQNNIGTNYQLPGLGGNSEARAQMAQQIELPKQNPQAIIYQTNGHQMNQIRPLSTKLGFQQLQPKQQTVVPLNLPSSQQNQGFPHPQIQQQLINENQSQQFNQLQHLQQMQEFHQNKKNKQGRSQFQNRSQAPVNAPSGTLSSKNLHVQSKNIIVQNGSQVQFAPDANSQQFQQQQYRNKKYQQQQRQQQISSQNDQSPYFLTNQNNDSRSQINTMGGMQQQIIENYNQFHTDKNEFPENQSPIKTVNSSQYQQDSRNKDSRNSKRSVVFSKNKHVGNFSLQQMNEKQQPSTPKISIGTSKNFKAGPDGNSLLVSSVQGHGIITAQPPTMSSANTQIRVNAPNSVKITKNTIKNIVIQKQNQQQMLQQQQQQQQLQYLQDMQIHLSNDDQSTLQQAIHGNQIKSLINQKRRSNVADHQVRAEAGLPMGQQKSLSSSSALNNHQRLGKKVYPTNMNVTNGPEQVVMMNQNQQGLFNKTMSNITTSATSNGGQSMSVSNQNPYNKSYTKTTNQNGGSNDPNLMNSLMVVKMNQGNTGQDGQMPQNMQQIQTINLKNLTPEQQKQVIQQHQQLMQKQQILEKQQQIQNAAQQNMQMMNNPNQQMNQTMMQENQNSQRSGNQGFQSKNQIRPQSQNNKLLHHSVNNSQQLENGQINIPAYQGHQQARSTSIQNASMQNGIRNTSNTDLLLKQQQQVQLQMQMQQQKGQMNQLNLVNVNTQPVPQAGQTQKLISSKHLQIQQIRMINNSSNDNYANNSDNDSSNRYGQQINQHQYNTQGSNGQNNPGTLPLPIPNSAMRKGATHGSPGNSKYFIKNQLRHIQKLNDDLDINDGERSNDDELAIHGIINQDQLENTSQGGHQIQGHVVHFKEAGMTLEDDVESMLSEQFNASNESMFRVRGIAQPQGIRVPLEGGGDSTFRCNDSMYDEDRGLISESEDGWYPDKEQDKKNLNDNDIDDISEHSSDEYTDEDPDDNVDPNVPKKVKKKKGEKGEKKKKKKRNLEDQGDVQGGKENNNNQSLPVQDKGAEIKKEMKITYKKLQEDTKPEKKGDKNTNTKNTAKDKGGGAKNQTKVTAQQIKVNIQTKKNEKEKEKPHKELNQQSNNFSSPMIKGGAKQDKANTTQKANQNTVNKDQRKIEINKQEDKKQDTIKEQPVAQTPLKKAKKNGLKLQALNNALPKNLQECYDRFFESDFKINPQFEYENANLASKFLEQFDEPDGKYLPIAIQILDSFLLEYGSESAYLDAEGLKLDQDQTHNAITEYLNNLGVQEWISINFQKNQVAPTSVTHDPKTGKCKMNIKLPCEYREGRMMGVLDHEIGTHFLRKHNEKNQQWYKKREKFDMRTCIATEEGLACTNQMVQTVKDEKCRPFLYRSALNYYAAIKAKDMSFVDLFKDLEQYVDSPQARWKFALRVKRGLSDTSQKGGLYKDQVYLEGAVQILSQRKNLNFKALLCGKISLYDLKRDSIYKILNYNDQLLPPFMEDMEEYLRCLDVIAECNHIITMEPDEVEDNNDFDNDQVEQVEVLQLDEGQDNNQDEDKEADQNDCMQANEEQALSQNNELLDESPMSRQEGEISCNPTGPIINNIDFIIQSSMQIEPKCLPDDQQEQQIQNNDSALENQQHDQGQPM